MGDQQTQQSQKSTAIQLTLSELPTSEQLKRPLALRDHIVYNGSLGNKFVTGTYMDTSKHGCHNLKLKPVTFNSNVP